MEWGARLTVAWHGQGATADLGALFAATAGLTGLQQALEDRRLAAEIEHIGHDWRAVLAVGQLAAPLWLAGTLVSLAGAFYDAATQAQTQARSQPNSHHLTHSTLPDQAEQASGSASVPVSVSPYTHDLVAALLAPLEDIIADVTAALADPAHRTALTVPLHVGPGGTVAPLALPVPLPVHYAQGLATGVRRVHTSALATLAWVQTTVARSPSPAPTWLAAGLRRLDGVLQAAAARLDMAEIHLAPLVVGVGAGEPARQRGARGGSSDSQALAAVCQDLWRIVDTVVVAGQEVADPHLLPEAFSAAPASLDIPVPNVPEPPQAASRPLPSSQAQEQRMRPTPLPLPHIAEGAPSLHERQTATPPPPATPDSRISASSDALDAPEVALPTIGDGRDQDTPPTRPDNKQLTPPLNVALPTIGEAPPRRPPLRNPLNRPITAADPAADPAAPTKPREPKEPAKPAQPKEPHRGAVPAEPQHPDTSATTRGAERSADDEPQVRFPTIG